jgi:translation initiation factor IF-2
MTDNKTTDKSRLKLTLKLPSSVSAQNIIAKNTVEKKLGKSSVQVTIKGRKKEVKNEDTNKTGLSKKEIADRLKILSSAKQEDESEIKASEILLQANKSKEEGLKKEEILVNEEKQDLEIIEKNEVNEVQEIVKTEGDIKDSEVSKKEASDYNLDEFDVRSKIKQSVEIANRQKEEREKVASEKRKKDQQEKLEKERVEKEKQKNKKPQTRREIEEEENLNKKKSYREEKSSARKLTYIIGGDEDDDSSGSFRKRKKHKIKQQDNQQKEYQKVSREVLLPDLITVAELAERMTEKTGDVVKKLFSMGMVVTSNQAVDAETAEIIIHEFGHSAKRVSHSDVENVFEEINESKKLPRAPVVTIMGHVDHGKTSLLDALRETNVVAGEHGGITQHIGASRVKVKDDKFITFLDTPGHEAFSEMRSRGANITDIVILVVAADDGVKAQTVEAINHAKAAGVPIIVAVNKIDKPDADASRVKNELLSHEIIAEEMGGDVMFIEVSAKTKKNLDKLEEAILLQAEVLDLKAPYEGKSAGVVVESRVDPSRGVVATLLVQEGSLDTGDLIVVGTSFGRVRKMTDDIGREVKIATPSIPVEILGLDYAPSAGDRFVEVSEERQAREIITYRERKEREDKALRNSAKSFEDILNKSGSGDLKFLNILLKGDVHGSVEAISGSVAKLNTQEVATKVIHSATGAISESDISLAAASNAIVIGFNVRASAQAKEMARLKNVEIRYYSIIYNLVDELKLLMSGMLAPSVNEQYLGQAEIRQVFKVSGAGKVAGSFVIDGVIKRSAKARLLRDNVVIHDGTLKTLKRFKEDVKEVKSGFECGIAFENYEDIKEKDVVECYEIVEQKREL